MTSWSKKNNEGKTEKEWIEKISFSNFTKGFEEGHIRQLSAFMVTVYTISEEDT